MSRLRSDPAFVSAIVRRALLECCSVSQPALNGSVPAVELFSSPEAEALKQEIVLAGRKLWERQYVDGNGGNISARLTPRFILCTPTLCSKGDLQAEELALVDLDNHQIIGNRPHTSEILLHLEIYRNQPKAKAVIHCHPPYATAHAIAGVVPPGNLIPEQEIFIGPVALAAYATPGTIEFARTVLPFVRQHNTILLAHHGIVCWADSVTHAEWLTEVIETYCRTVMIASQLRSPLQELPAAKIADLLAIKKKMGLPDPRIPEGPDCDDCACDVSCASEVPAVVSGGELDELVDAIAEQIAEYLERRAGSEA